MLNLLFNIIFVTLFYLNTASCSMLNKDKKANEEKVSIALVGSVDTLTQQIISEVLKKNKIVVSMSGSVVYDVAVNKDDVGKARKILREEPKLQGRWIQYTDKY